MKSLAAAGVGAGVHTFVLAPSSSAAKASRRSPGAPPNVVFILADDLGWPELGCYGNTFNETPRLDELARRGVRFSDAYAAAPVCSPTRASTLTGKYPPRTSITDFLKPEPAPADQFLDPGLATLPGRLGEAGYTSALIGKWHLTEDYSGPYRDRKGSPYQHGFGRVRVSESSYIGGGDYFHPYRFMPGVEALEEGEYLTDRLSQEAVSFMDAHADRPFFCFLSHYAVHTQLAAKEELVEKYRRKEGAGEDGNNPVLAAMLESIDQGVGMVVDRLEELGIAEDTLVVFMSDNGGEGAVTSNAPLRGQKALLYEGGIRVPLIAYWPGSIGAPGRVSGVPVHSVDIYPTLLELANLRGDPHTVVDGESMVPLLEGPESAGRSAIARRDALYWLFPHFNPRHEAEPHAAVRSGEHKLIQRLRDGRTEVYDLSHDIGETHNLVEERPTVARELGRKLADHIAEMPVPPPIPTGNNYPDVAFSDAFDAGLGAYTVLTPPPEDGVGDLSVADGVLRASGDAPYYGLLRAPVRARPRSAVVVDVHAFAGSAAEDQDTVLAGLVRDERNYVLIWHNNRHKATGWDVRHDGHLTAGGQVTGNRTGMLDGKVDLSARGSRLAFVLHGTAFSAFADAGDGWRFLFLADVEDLVDLGDPSVLGDYRYGFGVRGDSGRMALDRFAARQRTSGR